MPSASPVSASTRIAAPPERVWALISDLPRMGEWSPETTRVTWRGGVTSAMPGARFVGHNRNGVRRWSTHGVVRVAEPGRELSFDISFVGFPISRWTYRIEPDGDGCVVTESTADRRGPVMPWVSAPFTGVIDRASHNARTMEATLEALRVAAEQAG
ncbi:MAG TPA: SRPBCC family protein [Mycobacteriales bacterium]|nr:SRPBCC family protein [Mycobacteriales bacterium]